MMEECNIWCLVSSGRLQMVAEPFAALSQRDVDNVPAYPGCLKSQKFPVWSNHLRVALWVWARNLHVCAKHIDCVQPGLWALTIQEMRNVKLLN